MNDESMIEKLANEVRELMASIDVRHDGLHLWSNYENVTAVIVRLQEMHNELALMEIYGEIDPQLKKLRTMLIDPSIEQCNKIAAYESRKITAKAIERDLDK